MSTQYNDQPGPSPGTPTRSVLSAPPFPTPILPNVDARTAALRVLAQWFSSLAYQRTMSPSAPSEPFAIGPDRVFIEQPDNVEGLQFPAIGIIPGRGQYITRGLGGAEPDDETATVDGLALLVPFDYTELITVEGIGSKISERRSIIAAIEVAMGSYEGTTDLRLRMPEYYGLVCTFSLMERENVDDLEIPRGRRRVHVFLQMTVPVVVAARFATLDPTPGGNVKVELDLGAGGLADGLSATSLAATTGKTGLAGLTAMGLTRSMALTIARATLGLTPAQTDALTDDYLLALCQGLAQKNASIETWYGKPPYSPSETDYSRVLRHLPRFSLP
jgi:hypothetical protein